MRLNRCKLEQVKSVKLLALELDEQLSFDAHIDCLCRKLSYQSVSAYSTELRFIYQERSVYYIIIL